MKLQNRSILLILILFLAFVGASATFFYGEKGLLPGLLFALLAGLPALWMVRRWRWSMRQLVHHARRLVDGEMTVPVAVSGKGTVAMVATALEHLRRREVALKEELQALRQQIHANQVATLEMFQHTDMVENSTRAKSAFLANMSHEIRSPMNAVVGMTELALATDLSREQRQYLDIVMHSANALLALINNILDYSKIDAGKMELERIPFDPIQVMEQVCEILAVSAHRKQLVLLHEFAPELPGQVVGDPLRLQQVLTNLVTNAIKFTNLGEVRVTMGLAPNPPVGKVELAISVTDSGIGIAADRLEHVFGCFSQADSAVSRQFGGTGLGLAISRQLTELMGGRIGVESRPGQGSRFYFTISANRVEEAEAAGCFTRGMPLSGSRVLLAEHHAATRQVLTQLLSWQQIQVVAVDSVAAMGQLLGSAPEETPPFQMILLDGQLPGLDNMAVAERLKSPVWSRRIVLMLPTGLRRVNIPGCENLEIVRGIIKPVKRSELAEALSAVFQPTVAMASQLPRIELCDRGRHSCRILLVEDNAENQFLVLQILGQHGYPVTVAGNGNLAAELLARNRFDLILMDLHLPGMSGFQLTEAIRGGKLPGVDPQVPIVALTADALLEDREHCFKLGMNAFLAKPYKPRELLQLARRLMAEKNSPADQPPVTPPIPAKVQKSPVPSPERLVPFLALVDESLPELEQAVGQEYWVKVEVVAGTLRDEAQKIDANDFRNSALLLMIAARGGKSENARAGLVLLKDEVARCRVNGNI